MKYLLEGKNLHKEIEVEVKVEIHNGCNQLNMYEKGKGQISFLTFYNESLVGTNMVCIRKPYLHMITELIKRGILKGLPIKTISSGVIYELA